MWCTLGCGPVELPDAKQQSLAGTEPCSLLRHTTVPSKAPPECCCSLLGLSPELKLELWFLLLLSVVKVASLLVCRLFCCMSCLRPLCQQPDLLPLHGTTGQRFSWHCTAAPPRAERPPGAPPGGCRAGGGGEGLLPRSARAALGGDARLHSHLKQTKGIRCQFDLVSDVCRISWIIYLYINWSKPQWRPTRCRFLPIPRSDVF